MCVCYTFKACLGCFDWACIQSSQSEQQEKLEASGKRGLTLPTVELSQMQNDVCHLSLSFTVAFLGDIALDEEDLRSFKVDRIIDLAQRTVQTINPTNTGKNRKLCSTGATLRQLFLIGAQG